MLPSSSRAHNLFHQRIRIALVLGDFGGVALEAPAIQLRACFFQHGIAQHLDQPLLPVWTFFLKARFSFFKYAS